MRLVVTGCAGFIGSRVAEIALGRGDSVAGVDCLTDTYAPERKRAALARLSAWEGFEDLRVDLAVNSLEGMLAGADAVLHFAGEPGVRASWGERYEQYLRNNLHATQRLLEATRGSGQRLVYASSSSVYGEPAQLPTPETASTRPLSPYGQTKLGGEQLCEAYRAGAGVDVVSLRLFTVFGPGQRPDMAIERFCRAALRGRPVNVFGDGLQTRDFTYVDDVAAAALSAVDAQLGETRILNVGGGAPASVRDVLAVLQSLTGGLEVVWGPPGRGEPRASAADTRRAGELLGWAPRTRLADGLARQLEHLASEVADTTPAV